MVLANFTSKGILVENRPNDAFPAKIGLHEAVQSYKPPKWFNIKLFIAESLLILVAGGIIQVPGSSLQREGIEGTVGHLGCWLVGLEVGCPPMQHLLDTGSSRPYFPKGLFLTITMEEQPKNLEAAIVT